MANTEYSDSAVAGHELPRECLPAEYARGSSADTGQAEREVPCPPRGARRFVRWVLAAVLSIVFLSISGVFGNRYWRTAKEKSYRGQCREARTAGNWGELRGLGQEWSAWDPSSVDAKLFEADADTQLQDFESAAECLRAIPDSHPKTLPSLAALSALQFGPLSRPADGVRTCERMLKLDSRATPAHEQLIEYYALTLQRRNLERQIRYAIDCSREPPKAYIYLFLMDTMRIAGASEANSRWLEQSPDSELFAVARILHMPEPEVGVKNPSGDDKYSLVDALLQRFPNNLELLAYKIDVSLRSGDLQEVMKLLASLPSEADDDNRFWRAKGWLHLNRNELPKANEALNEVTRLFPLDWNALNLLADVMRKESRLAEAETLHEIVQSARDLRIRINAVALDSDIPPEILADLARLAKQCGDLQVSDALSRRLGLSLSATKGSSRASGPKTAD